MKKLYSCAILLMFLTACTTDTVTTQEKTIPINVITNDGAVQRGELLPANSANPYDLAGRLHNELFEAYYSLSSLPATIDSLAIVAEAIGSTNNEFNSLKTTSYVPVSGSRVSYIVSNISTSPNEIIDAAPLSSAAKVSVAGFIDDLLPLYETAESYDAIYNFITNYESGVIQSTQFTTADKEIILTTTSIARYSTYMGRKKPKSTTDADWTIFITNIAGGIEGASNGIAEAIMKAFVTGVAQNNFN